MKRFPFESGHPVYPAGTVVMIRVYGTVKHYGLCTGYGTVIHASRRFGKVEESDFEIFCHGRHPQVVQQVANGSAMVARARSRKGQRYNVLNNNCEHFITWVLEGKGRSSQLGPMDARRLSKD